MESFAVPHSHSVFAVDGRNHYLLNEHLVHPTSLLRRLRSAMFSILSWILKEASMGWIFISGFDDEASSFSFHASTKSTIKSLVI